MYVLFRVMNWKPSDYWGLPEGEKIVVRAFLEKYAEEEKKQQDEMEKARRRAKAKK